MKSLNLALVWDENSTFARRPVPSPKDFLFIENQGDMVWGTTAASTGQQSPFSTPRLGSAYHRANTPSPELGRRTNLEPGERVPVHAAFTSDMSEHPPGRYELEATLKELHLRSERKLVQLD